ncbi:MAG: hypothetical protein WC465_00225 [Patescibacteria group bacterium]
MLWPNKKKIVITSIYDLITSAERAMPAYFTSNYQDDVGFVGTPRPKTFNINFDINPVDEYEMASFVWNKVPKSDIYQKADHLFEATIILGEDITVGAYIICRLGNPHLVPKLTNLIVKNRLNSFSRKNLYSAIIKIDPSIPHYLRRCMDFGKMRAELDDKQKNEQLPLNLSLTKNSFDYYRELR